jgi:hypothetical protein
MAKTCGTASEGKCLCKGLVVYADVIGLLLGVGGALGFGSKGASLGGNLLGLIGKGACL